MSKPRLLDRFCGSGGATKGYQRAGFYVVGVDIDPQPNYCGDEFYQADAMTFPLDGYDAHHSSPPCQFATQMSARWRGKGGKTDDHINLLTPVLEQMRSINVPWVVENVVGARLYMQPTLLLHGGMFGLGVHRPRFFQSNVLLLAPRAPACVWPIGVYGDRPDGRTTYRYRNNGNMKGKSLIRAAKSLEEAQVAMGMDWADWHGTKEAIPPAYTRFIGEQLMAALVAS